MTKRISYTVVLSLKPFSRNAGKELGINEKLVWDWRKKKTNNQEKSKQSDL